MLVGWKHASLDRHAHTRTHNSPRSHNSCCCALPLLLSLQGGLLLAQEVCDTGAGHGPHHTCPTRQLQPTQQWLLLHPVMVGLQKLCGVLC